MRHDPKRLRSLTNFACRRGEFRDLSVIRCERDDSMQQTKHAREAWPAVSSDRHTQIVEIINALDPPRAPAALCLRQQRLAQERTANDRSHAHECF